MRMRKAQAWGFDMLIAVSLFSMTMLLFYLYSLNRSSETEDVLKSLQYDANIVAQIVLSEGYPQDWIAANVITPGILTDKKINQTKIEQFYDLSQNDYEDTKKLLQTKYDFYIFLSQPIEITGDTVPGMGRNYTNPKNLIKLTRVTTYQNKPTTFTIYVWN